MSVAAALLDRPCDVVDDVTATVLTSDVLTSLPEEVVTTSPVSDVILLSVDGVGVTSGVDDVASSLLVDVASVVKYVVLSGGARAVDGDDTCSVDSSDDADDVVTDGIVVGELEELSGGGDLVMLLTDVRDVCVIVCVDAVVTSLVVVIISVVL